MELKTLFCCVLCSFIISIVLPEVPKDVTIEIINSSAVRVGWNVAPSADPSGNPVITHYVELSTASGNVMKRQSSSGKQSVIFSQLLTSTQYRVRVQAESTAGNGSSSLYVSFKTTGSKSIYAVCANLCACFTSDDHDLAL